MDKKGGSQHGAKGPDPSRYLIRSELEDKSGFKVIGINHIFKYDQHGGWYDEYGNYYDKDNKPASHPKPTVKEEHKTSPLSSHEPDPKRFENFTLLPDETGFKVQGTDHIFYFDIYGGWFDEHENYYDADGNPCTPPEYSEEEENPADRFVNEYESGSEDEKEDELAPYDDVYYNAENMKVLAHYLKDQEVHLKIRNLPYKSTEDDFEKFLVDKKIEWINFEFELNNDGKFNGTCYVDLDKPQAEKLVELNGHQFQGRDMKIVVLPPESGDEEGESDEEEQGGHQEEEGGHKEEHGGHEEENQESK